MSTTKVTDSLRTVTAVDGSKITTGTIPEARIAALAASKLTGALPAISGANLTNLPSEITKSSSDPTISTNPAGGVGTVWANTTSGEMYICTTATAGANVWTNVGPGTGNVVPITHISATGGTITTDGDYKVHSFTSSGTFTVIDTFATGVEYLVIAGGGGGSQSYAGGGGAGGYLTATGFAVLASTAYSITVGAGGTGHPSPGVIGGNSVFSTITSVGGGRGGHTNGEAGGAGGSGGGGAWRSSSGGAGGAATAGQGNAGGSSTTNQYGGAGGGGAGSVGLSNSGSAGGNGGTGLSSSITGSAVSRGGGGGGGGSGSQGVGVDGGGTGQGSAGVANKGGGGGGAWSGNGQSGGSGIVIIRYKFQN